VANDLAHPAKRLAPKDERIPRRITDEQAVRVRVSRNPGGPHPLDARGDRSLIRQHDIEVVKADGARRWRRRANASPCVEPDVMVISARRHEQSARSVTLHQIEAEHVDVEPPRVVEARDLQVNVADRGAGSQAVFRGPGSVGQQAIDVERLGHHLEAAATERPLAARPVSIDLDAVAVDVGEVQRFADAMIGGALHDRVGFDEPSKRAPQFDARGHQNGEVIEAEPRRPSLALMQDESEMGLVEADGAVQIPDGEMDRSDVGRWIDDTG